MSIVDRREIEFDAKAVITVMSRLRESAVKIGLLALEPTDVRFLKSTKEIEVVYGQFPSIRLPAERVAVLLITYCIRSSIPIPRNASKGTRLEESSIVLFFETRIAQMPVPRNDIWQNVTMSRQMVVA